MQSRIGSPSMQRHLRRRRRSEQKEWRNCDRTLTTIFDRQELHCKDRECHVCHHHQQQAQHQTWKSPSLPTVARTRLLFSSLVLIVVLFAPSTIAQSATDSTTTIWNGSINATINPSSKHITYWQKDILGTGGTIDLSNLDISTIPREQDNREFETSKLDLVVFHTRQQCQRMDGCGQTWSNTGVGAMGGNDDSAVFWCCRDDAVQQGLCASNEVGRLIVNNELFGNGFSAFELDLLIPKDGLMTEKIDDTNGIFEVDGSGTYVLLVAQCNDKGRPVQIIGDYTWTTEQTPDTDVCGKHATNVEKQSSDIADLTLEPKSDQVTFIERHLPKKGILHLNDLRLRNYDDVIPPTTVESLVNVVAFRLDSACDSASACGTADDWIKLGIGARRHSDETYQYCCTDQNIQEGLCQASHHNELIYNLNKTIDEECGFFQSRDWLVPIPRRGWITVPVQSTEDDDNFAEGRYIIVMANCNPNGRPMEVRGKMEWNSYKGDNLNGPLNPTIAISSGTGIDQVTTEPAPVASPVASPMAVSPAPAPEAQSFPPADSAPQPTDPTRVPPPNNKPNIPPDDDSITSESSTPTGSTSAPSMAPAFSTATSDVKKDDGKRHRSGGHKLLLFLVIMLCSVVFCLLFRQYKMAKNQVKLRKHIFTMEALEDLHDAQVDWAVDTNEGQTQYRDNPHHNQNGGTSGQIEMARRVSWADETAVNPSRKPPPTPPTGAFLPRIDSDTGEAIRLTDADLC